MMYEKSLTAVRSIRTLVVRHIVALAILGCIWLIYILADAPADPFVGIAPGGAALARFDRTF